MKNKSLFIVFEGIDGSGKTTLINSLKNDLEIISELKKKFKKIIFIQEPGAKNKKFEKKIKNLIFDEKSNLNHKTKALLFFVTRSEQIEKTIIPNIKKNTLIICDRFYLSTLVYQAGILKLNEKWIDETNKFITENIRPNLTFYLNISKEEYLKRLKQKQDEKTENSFDKIFKNYEELVKNYKKYILKYKDQLGKIIEINSEEKTKNLVKKILDEIKNFW